MPNCPLFANVDESWTKAARVLAWAWQLLRISLICTSWNYPTGAPHAADCKLKLLLIAKLSQPEGRASVCCNLAAAALKPSARSLPQAAANAIALAQLPDLGGQAIATWTRARFVGHWRRGGFYRLLNRLLFRAARPEERVKVFAHFYRLNEALVSRFYAGRLTALDKVRILTGKPPVPLFKALKAMIS